MAISEFQLALIGAGAALIAGVWGYNNWQELRQRKAARQMFDADKHDVLVDDLPGADSADFSDSEPQVDAGSMPASHASQRIEPVIQGADHENYSTRQEPQFTAPTEASFRSTATDSGAEDFDAPGEPPASAGSGESAVAEPGEEVLDPMVEFGIALPPESDVATLRQAWPQSANFTKCIRWVARDTRSGLWLDAVADGTARNTWVAIQLADRRGAIDKSELGAFCEAAEAAAATQGALIEVPAIDDVIIHARALDDLCASVDIQIALHLVGNNGQFFAGSKLRGLLEAAGLRLAADGMFYLNDDKGAQIFSVCQSGTQPFVSDDMRTSTVADVTLWLDVPRVANGARAFDHMLAIARRLATPLEGLLVDDRRNPLSDSAINSIRAKVIELQGQMAAQGIAAGGRRALRLFS